MSIIYFDAAAALLGGGKLSKGQMWHEICLRTLEFHGKKMSLRLSQYTILWGLVYIWIFGAKRAHTLWIGRSGHVPSYALATPRPRQPDKIMPDGARQKLLVLSGFLDQKFEGKLKEAGQIERRQHQILSLFVIKVKFWRCLVQSGQLPSSFLQTSGPGSQTEPATFSSGSVWHDFVWLSGLGVASPLNCMSRFKKLQASENSESNIFFK